MRELISVLISHMYEKYTPFLKVKLKLKELKCLYGFDSCLWKIEPTTNHENFIFTMPAFSSIFSRWPNHIAVFFLFLIPFNFSLTLYSSAIIIFSGLTMHIFITILASFLSSTLTSSSFSGHVSISHSIIRDWNLTRFCKSDSCRDS